MIKNVITSIAIILSPVAESKPTYTRTILKAEVVDGDTIKGLIACSDKLVCGEWYFRIKGVDTPETGRRAECEYERLLGVKATNHVKSLMTHGALVTGSNLYRKGCAFGRICGDIHIGGVNIAKSLIQANLAVETERKQH